MVPLGRPICCRTALSRILPNTSSVLLVPPKDGCPAWMVVGTIAGEVHFMPVDDQRYESTHVQLKSSPVTSLSHGALTGQHKSELVAICADGFTQSIVPSGNLTSEGPLTVFTQVIQANVTSSYILDVDNDGNQELVVFMTDRVVRTFRWSQAESRLQPIRKWEVPCQITAISIGEPCLSLSHNGVEAWISQLGASFYVCLPLSGKEDAHAAVVYQKEVLDHGILIMPYRCHYTQIHGALINNVVVVVNGKERILVNPGWTVVSTAVVRLPSFNVVATVDLRGLFLIYAFNERAIKEIEIPPLLRIETQPNSERMTIAISNDNLLLAVSSVEGKLVVNSIPIETIVNEFNR